MQFEFLLEQVVNGLVLGGYYLLIALGLSLIFSVGGVVNLAHGAFYALGAYVSVQITRYLGFGPAVVLSPVAVALLGILFERYILRRFYSADPILSLLVTFGLAMVAEQAIRIIWGSAPLSASIPPALRGSVIVGDFLFSRYRLMLLAVVAAVLLGVWLLLHKTSFGRVVRAGIQRPDMVAALGIRLQPYMTAIVMLGVGMAAMGGAFFAPITIVHPAMGCRGHHRCLCRGGDRRPRQFLGCRDCSAAGRRRAWHHHPFRAGGRRSVDLRVDVCRCCWCGPAACSASASRNSNEAARGLKYQPLLLAGLATDRAAIRFARARPVAQYRNRGGDLRDRDHGPQSVCRLHRAGVVRPRHVVRHRRLCRRPDPASTGSAARSGCRCCCRWSWSP